jgi:chromosome segregation ATPase
MFFFVYCILTVVNFTSSITVNSQKNQVINELQKREEELIEELSQDKTKISELEEERDQLQEHEEELTSQLDKLHSEFKGLHEKIKTLQERNQALCESLGDFLRFKRRKTSHATEVNHTHNLREKKPVSYAGMDAADEDTSDSDFEVLQDRK